VGSVTFDVDGASVATQPVTNGTAQTNITLSGVGVHVVDASYSGSANAFGPSQATVGPASLITTLAGGGVGDGDPATIA
jgi:hypothetical protein